MSNRHGSKWCRPSKRLAIYHRDGFACVYCGATLDERALTLDHVRPRRGGADNSATNLVTCCLRCNSVKQDLTMRQWFVLLRMSGVDTSRLSAKIRRHTARPIDLSVGRAILARRRGKTVLIAGN
jgi:hypothetical protein